MDWDKLFSFLKSTLAISAVAGLAYLGETGKDGGAFSDLWLAAKTASPFAAMYAIMNWLWERRDRIRTQIELMDRTISFVEAMNEQSTAREKIVDAIKQLSSLVVKQEMQEIKKLRSKKRGRR